MLLELGRLRDSVVTVPFSVGEEGYDDGRLAASSDSHDSLKRSEESHNRTRWRNVLRTENYREEESVSRLREEGGARTDRGTNSPNGGRD